MRLHGYGRAVDSVDIIHRHGPRADEIIVNSVVGAASGLARRRRWR
jgi:hypothetical protein